MQISLIVAASENNVIGKENDLPWHLPLDLKFFKKTTLGKPIVMGRKTFESFGKALPKRLNIVLSGHLGKAPEGTMLFKSVGEALAYLKGKDYPEIFIIGGGQIFSEALSLADTIYLTRVHTIIEDGDAFFPDFKNGKWQLEWEEDHFADEQHAFDFTFQKWVREGNNGK